MVARNYGSELMKDQNTKALFPEIPMHPRQVLYTVKIYSDWSKLTYEDTEVEKVLKAKGLHVLCNFLQQIPHARGLHSNRPQICS